MPTFIIAEVGINHNGDLDIAKQLIASAADVGANAVKFQKRNIDLVYTKELLDSPRESKWGTTQREQKAGLEFGPDEFEEIDRYSKEKGISWFASAWDVDSQIFLRRFDCKYNKVASAMLTHRPLLERIIEEKRHTFISTGMSSMEEISAVVELFKASDCPFELMHCNSAYPMPDSEANLCMINTLQKRFDCAVGYSGHEVGLSISLAAAVMGATSIERHITLDRAMSGSDQAASVEVAGFAKLVKMIRTVEVAMGDGEKKVSATETSVRGKLAPWSVEKDSDHPNNPHTPS